MRLVPPALRPSRISGQIAIIIVVSLIVIHAILTIGFLLERRERGGAPPRQLGPLIQLIDGVEPRVRPRLVSDIAHALPQLDITLAPSAPAGSASASDDARIDGLKHFLGAGFGVALIDPAARSDGSLGRVAVRLRDGGIVTARLPPAPPRPPPMSPLTMTILFVTISMPLLGLWAARGLTAPLRAFATAAEGFSPDAEIAPLPEGGPEEIRAAARALNRMRQRIKSLIHDRTRMLAAVGHDLRTPITRLRLRSEFIDEAGLRIQMLNDLDQMSHMVESVLIFLREGRSQEAATMIDVAISLHTICDQFADIGRNVSYDGPQHVAIEAQPGALHRAVSNLIDNAVRYGDSALVRLTVEPATVVIAIEDDGPGIPDGEKDAMLEPFVRGDAARRMDQQSGFGLGLSIARAAIAAHGGTLALIDRQPNGLITRIELPTCHKNGSGGAPNRTLPTAS
jgi:signal transduction histidine kinase